MLVWRNVTVGRDDSEVCEKCLALNGVAEAGTAWLSLLGPTYNVSMLAVTGSVPVPAGPPPLHPSCRCFVERL